MTAAGMLRNERVIHIHWDERAYTRKMRTGKAVALDSFTQMVCFDG